MSAIARPTADPAGASTWRRLAGGLDRLLALLLVVYAVVVVIGAAGWLDGRGEVAAVPLAGLVLGLALARWSALPPLVAHWLALAVGGALTLRLAGPLAAPTAAGWPDEIDALALRVYRWVELTQRGQAGPDAVLTSVGLTASLFLLAYFAAWVQARRGWFWWAVAPAGGVIVLVSGLTRPASALPLLLYLVGAVVLIARGHAVQREAAWGELGVVAPARFRPWLVGVGAALATLVAAASLVLPGLGRNDQLASAWEDLTRPVRVLETAWRRVIDQLQGGSALGGSYASFGPGFEVGGFPAVSDTPVARVGTSEPRYLKAVSYDRYTGRGWQTTTPESFSAADGSGTLFSSQVQLASALRLPVEPANAPVERLVVELLRPKGALLLAPGQFVGASAPINVRVGWVHYERVWLSVQSSQVDQLPVVLRPLVSQLRTARGLPPMLGVEGPEGGLRQEFRPGAEPRASRELAVIQAEVERLRRQRGIVVVFSTDDRGRVTELGLSGYLPRYEDVEGVYATEPPAPGTAYWLLTTTPAPSAESLRLADMEPAPNWLRERYLPLPASLPARVRQLATEITEHERTAYDKARALERSLRTLPYDEATLPPPAGRDVVDHFLFEGRRGYCEHFASAMVVMARTQGIPARVVTGYSPGEAVEGGRLVRERNAHAWAELYFAGHGWVTFEPTPSVVDTSRGDTQTSEPALTPLGPMPLAPPEPAEPAPGDASTPTGVLAAPGPAWLGPLTRAAQVGLLLAFVGAVAISALWWQGVRGLSGAGRWYGRLVWLGRWTGLRPGPTATPGEFAEQVGRAVPAAATPAATLSRLYAEERYGGRPLSPLQESRARRAWRQARAALLWRLAWRRDP